MSEGVLIVGATSGIAEAAARAFAQTGARLFLAARNHDRLESIAADLQVRGATEVSCWRLDVTDHESHEGFVAAAFAELGRIDVVLMAHGVLPDQEQCEANPEAAVEALEVNFLSVVRLATLIAPRLEAQGRGCLAVISSVAGDRGRQSNYVYGASKGGLDVFLAGLRNRLARRGVRVVTIKPGFVDTAMTAHLDKGPLFASARAVGEGIHRACHGRRDVVYLPWFWRPIMGVIRAIPEPIFKKLSL